MDFFVATEGACDLLAARKLLQVSGHSVHREFNCRGKGSLDKRIAAYANAARQSPWLVIRDLDRDAPCAPELRAATFAGNQPQLMCYRVAVRTMEAWLMADKGALASWMGVSVARIPNDPENIDDPKAFLASVATHSSKRDLRDRMVAVAGTGARVGPEYEAAISEFISDQWDASRAAQLGNSASLTAALAALKSIS